MDTKVKEIITKIYNAMDVQYDGNFINGDYMFQIGFNDYENYWEQPTIKSNRCTDENDALIYLVITTFIDCINKGKEYVGITDYSIESFQHWLRVIGDEDCNNIQEIEYMIEDDSDIYYDFKAGLDMVLFARNTLTKEELLTFGRYVQTDIRYKRIVARKVSQMNKKLNRA